MITVTVVGSTQLVERLRAISPQLRAKLNRTVTALTLMLEAYVKLNKLSGQVLKVRTGQLKASIQSRVENRGDAVYGFVYSAGNVKYAAIHEFGGTTSPHVITATKGQALAFMMGGKQVFAKSVQHPGSKMPERSFLRSAVADKQVTISAQLKAAVLAGIQEGVHG